MEDCESLIDRDVVSPKQNEYVREWEDCQYYRMKNATLQINYKRLFGLIFGVVVVVIVLAMYIGGSIALAKYGEGKEGFAHYAFLIVLFSPLWLSVAICIFIGMYYCAEKCFTSKIPSRIECV